ncbi:MAG: pyridoxine 5'-phosphate synthase [Ignavibacteria bacterium GWF2_33_9]|nr:MAG: pyridoxine 5'-phosphate synthase [Ignavibacteria bacterium GWF2_33_9]
MITLNVNIDHIATLRNSRGGSEPEPIIAAGIAELAGATGIVAHLREDRRHMKDRDIRLLREIIQTKFDLEMAATDEIIQIALEIKPDLVTIVPEKRQELTTEGGLDVRANNDSLSTLCKKMHDAGIEVSLFVDPDEMQIEEAKIVGADMVELHTGVYANARGEAQIKQELKEIIAGVEFAHNIRLKVAAGHGLNYVNTQAISRIPNIQELSIGHSIISRAAFVGLDNAVKEMLHIMHNCK